MPDGLNKVMLIGNLGKDPEMRYTANGSAVTTFSLAVNRSYASDGERREETEWFNIVAWNKLAEQLSQHLLKGQKVFVEGRFSTRSWDGQDGQKHYRTEVVTNQVQMLGRPLGGVQDFSDGAETDEQAPAGVNKVMLIGALETEPEMRYTATGLAVTNFRLAVSRIIGADDERREATDWYTVVAWTKLAELVTNYLHKGQKVYVEGRLTTRSWDGQDGQKQYRTEVVANQVLFLDRPQGAGLPDMPGDIDPDDLPFQ